ncbi:MAG: M23 family metallopeptidase [Oscillospiraceae bacterium]|nr:M23 family metallopeptidase [Oscillospiraceae bacterium]
MSTLSNLIFHNQKHYVTSPFGRRSTISTAAGNTSSYHYGTDYGTNGKKLAQYALEDGEIISCGRASDGALFVWVKYPRLGVKMLHYHLNSYKVKTGQKVNKNTVLGYTGKTGKATGIHLHLGMKKLSGGGWIDPETWSRSSYTAPAATSAKYFKKYTGNSTSIVNALAAVGAQTSFSYRAKIAAANGIKNYVGSAAQNSLMLSMLKSGKLIKP